MLKSYALPTVVMAAVIGLFFLGGHDTGLGAVMLWAAPVGYVLASAWLTLVAGFDPRPWPLRLILIWAPLIAPAVWMTWIMVHADTDGAVQGMALMYSLMVFLPVATISFCASIVLLIYFTLKRFEPSMAESG
jgi:hypothetical protein